MRTDMLRPTSPSRARNVALAGIAYSIGVFGLLKWPTVETHVLLPFTQWQGRIAQAALGAPVLPIDVTLACSGADAFALCAGAILAYPAPLKFRLGGTAAGFALILILNSLRIGTLGRVAASPVLFETLHVYVWPAILILAIAAYVFGWMQFANGRVRATSTDPSPGMVTRTKSTGVFAAWAVVLVALFVATSALYLESPIVLIVAAFIAQSAAALLHVLGIEATTAANVLWTASGGFQVTQECISTPLIPLYGAAALTYCTRWRWRALALAAAIPLFIGLGIARLLVVALPAAIFGSPLFLVHAFYQLLLAVVVVCGAVAWRRGRPAWRVSVMACLAGALCGYVLAPIYAGALSALAIEIPFNDVQGAMASLPSFQAGLFVALSIATMTWLAWRRFAAGFGALIAVQVAAFGGLHVLARFSDLTLEIRDVRAWSIAAPLAIVVIGLVCHDRARE